MKFLKDIKEYFFPKIASMKELSIGMLKTGNICISYCEGNPSDVWGFLLYDNDQKLIVWNQSNEIIFDDVVEKASKKLFSHGHIFAKLTNATAIPEIECHKKIFSFNNKIIKRLNR